MAKKIEIIEIDKLQLDIDNKRGLSKRQSIINGLSDTEHQLLLLFCMIRHEQIHTLISDMINNPELTVDLLSVDKIIVQESEEGKYYNVREGNRRVSSLKIIFQPSLMTEAETLVTEKELFTSADILEFKKNVSRIEKILEIDFDFQIDKLEVISFGITEEDTRRLNTIIYRMHVDMKKEWQALDKRLDDYNDIINQINKGASSIDNAIDNVINEKYYLSEAEVKRQKKDFHEFFLMTHINLFLLRKAENSDKLSIEQKNAIRARMNDSYYRPIGEVLPRMLRNGFGVECQLVIESNKPLTEFTQQKDYLKIKNIGDLIYDLFLAIMNLDGKKPYANTTFNTPKKFKENYSNIYQKYVEDTINENDTEEKPTDMVNPVIVFSDGSTNKPKKLYNINTAERLALHTLILEGRDENNKSISKDDIYIKIRENGIECLNGPLTSIMIDVPDQASEKNIEFYFNPEFKNRITVFRMIYSCPEETPFPEQKNYILDTTLVKANKQFEYIDFSEKLVEELERLQYSTYPYISSYIYRGMWESAIDILISVSSNSTNGQITAKEKRGPQVEEIAQKIYVLLNSNSRIKGIAKFYGLQDMNAKNTFLPNDYKYFTDIYTSLNNAPHGSPQALATIDIDAARNRTSKWLYILNYMIYCCRQNIDYKDYR